jgi:hypothetical protein
LRQVADTIEAGDLSMFEPHQKQQTMAFARECAATYMELPITRQSSRG